MCVQPTKRDHAVASYKLSCFHVFLDLHSIHANNSHRHLEGVSSAELRWPISTLASRARGTSALSTSPALKNVCTNRVQTLFRTSEPSSNGQGPSAYIVDGGNSIPNFSHGSPSRDGLVVSSIFAYQSKGRWIEPRLERHVHVLSFKIYISYIFTLGADGNRTQDHSLRKRTP